MISKTSGRFMRSNYFLTPHTANSAADENTVSIIQTILARRNKRMFGNYSILNFILDASSKPQTANPELSNPRHKEGSIRPSTSSNREKPYDLENIAPFPDPDYLLLKEKQTNI